MNGTGYKTVYKGTYNATDIQIDWLGGNIYWTESDSKALKCVTLNGKFDKLLVETENPPMFLLLDPPRRCVYLVYASFAAQALKERFLAKVGMEHVLKML